MVKARLARLGGRVRSRGSDRAKALSKRADTGLACLSVPDWCHLLHACVKRYALAICSRLRPAPPAWEPAQERLATGQGAPPDRAAGQQAQAVVEAHEADGQRWP